MEEKCPLKLIIILSDGIRGHLNQSRGVAMRLAEATGAEIVEEEAPLLAGMDRFKSRAYMKRLMSGNRRDARDWLAAASGDRLLRRVGQSFAKRGLGEGTNKVLIISAGSSPAPYNLALSHIWRCVCATIMTPSIIGTDFFDFAIVPEHDNPERKPNIFVTLGSPNSIDKKDMEKEAEHLLAEYPSFTAKKWSVLIGGDDANYVIDAEWIRQKAGAIFSAAEKEGASLYITTSRRTSAAAEEALAELIDNSQNVRYVLYASKNSFNPIPAMLGFSDEIFCTEDSVNMVSETVTGGHVAVLMRTGYRKGIRRLLQIAAAALVNMGALPQRMMWGVPKFNIFYDRLMRHDALIEFEDWVIGSKDPLFSGRDEARKSSEFNEARRAAEWICRSWPKT